MVGSAKPRAVGLNHVALEVGDIEEALAFYGRIFDFQLRGKSRTVAFIDLGDQFIALQAGRKQPADDSRHVGWPGSARPSPRLRKPSRWRGRVRRSIACRDSISSRQSVLCPRRARSLPQGARRRARGRTALEFSRMARARAERPCRRAVHELPHGHGAEAFRGVRRTQRGCRANAHARSEPRDDGALSHLCLRV